MLSYWNNEELQTKGSKIKAQDTRRFLFIFPAAATLFA
jgi:hypothetical protein